MFERQVDCPKRINLLSDDVERNSYVIVNITGAMAKRFMSKACNKSCASEATLICNQTCSDCMARPTCAFSAVRIPCAECKRHFRSEACFAKHKQSTSNKKSICERKRCCATCRVLKRSNKHECNKQYCGKCKQNRGGTSVQYEASKVRFTS